MVIPSMGANHNVAAMETVQMTIVAVSRSVKGFALPGLAESMQTVHQETTEPSVNALTDSVDNQMSDAIRTFLYYVMRHQHHQLIHASLLPVDKMLNAGTAMIELSVAAHLDTRVIHSHAA